MKTIIVIICLLLNFHLLSAQESSKSLAEKFSERSGILVSKEFIELGIMDEIDIRYVKMSDLLTGEGLYALRFEYQPNNEIVATPKIAYIDSDEMELLKKAIKKLQSSVLTQHYSSQADFTFRCRSGLVFGYFYDFRNKKWVSYIQIDVNDNKSTIQVENDGFAYLYNLIENAQKIK